MGEYCEICQLCNLKKDCNIFQREVRKPPKFVWGYDVLERADSYIYLSILVNYDHDDDKISNPKCDLFARRNRVLFSCTGVKSGDTKGDYLKRGTFLTAHSRNGRHISGQFTPPLYPTIQVSYCWIYTVTPHPNARSQGTLWSLRGPVYG